MSNDTKTITPPPADVQTLASANSSNLEKILDASLEKQNKLTAGENITISGNTISATDTTYTAGDNVKIDENNVISVPDATSEVAGVVKPYSVLNSAPSVNGATDEEGRYYPVQTDSTNKLVVNVPWYANEGGGSSSGIEEITASGTAPLTLTATQTNSRVNISGSVDLSDYLTSAVADETYQEKLKYYSESDLNVYINLNSSGNFYMDTPSNTLRLDLLSSSGILLQTNFQGGNINFNTLASNSGVYYNGSEVATVDDLDEKQDKLEYYSESPSTTEAQILVTFDNGNQAGLTVNGTTVGIASAGVPILVASVNADTTIQALSGDVHLRATGTGKKAYYNDSEIITEQSLLDELDTKQDKLQCYYEDNDGAHIDTKTVSILGDGDVTITAGGCSVTVGNGITLDSGDVQLNLSGSVTIGNDWVMHSGDINRVVLVDSLPSSPYSNTLYLIPE